MVKGHTLYIFNAFKFAEICFMFLNMVYIGVYTTDTWKGCICCCCCVEYSLNVCGLKVVLSSSIPLQIYPLAFYQLLREVCWILQLQLWICPYFLLVYFTEFDTLLFDICTFKILCLIGGLSFFSHYIMSLYVSGNILWF